MLRSLLFLFLLLPCLSSAQWMPVTAVEFTGGINSHRYFDFISEDDRYRSDYSYGTGYSFRVGLRYESLLLDWPVRAMLGIDRVRGSFDVFDDRVPLHQEARGEIDRTILTINLYGWNFKIWKNLEMNIGFQVSQLLWEEAEGWYQNYSPGNTNGFRPLKELSDPFSSEFQIGLLFRLAYQFDIGNDMFLYPHYSYLYHYLPVFRKFPAKTFSMRHYFGFGLMRKFK